MYVLFDSLHTTSRIVINVDNSHCYIAGNFFPTLHDLIGHFKVMTSNNKTVSCQNLRVGNIAKSMTSEGNSALIPTNVDHNGRCSKV